MDGLGGHYAKCSKSDRKTNTLYYLNVESKKYNKLVIIVKKKKEEEEEEEAAAAAAAANSQIQRTN